MEGEAFRKLGRSGTLLWLSADTESLHLSPPNLGIANPLLYAVTEAKPRQGGRLGARTAAHVERKERERERERERTRGPTRAADEITTIALPQLFKKIGV